MGKIANNVFDGETARDRDSARRQVAHPTHKKMGGVAVKYPKPRTIHIKMGRLKGREKEEREKNIELAIRDYYKALEPSIRASAEKYSIPWTTLRDRLKGARNRRESHRRQQLLTEHEEKTIVQWCKRMDDYGFPLRVSLVKEMAAYLVKKRLNDHKLGKHWLSRFLDRNPELASRFSSRLDRQRAYASNPAVLRDYFNKVCYCRVIAT
jgi:Tc5 transposase DNA-binding domain